MANRQTAANAVSEWVFPSYRPGSHLNADHVRIRLRKIGFPLLCTRIGTWQSITQTTPPPVLADAIGLNHKQRFVTDGADLANTVYDSDDA